MLQLNCLSKNQILTGNTKIQWFISSSACKKLSSKWIIGGLIYAHLKCYIVVDIPQ